MSQETIEYLNQNTLIGFSEKRGHAWHYKASAQGQEPNHYPGAIPIEDVLRRLFNWEAVEGEIHVDVLNEQGVLTVIDPERKAIVRPDTGTILGIFKQGYQIHQFSDWLLEKVAYLLDDELSIGSAGLLRGGALAWVQIEVPDTIVTPSGVAFRPHLLAGGSHDGSLSSTYGRTITNAVCDNTMSAALGEALTKVKVRHSRYSNLKFASAKEALDLVYNTADEFSAKVEQLTNMTVTDAQWSKFNDLLIPVPEKEGRGQTMATNKQNVLKRLWDTDTRVAPWKNTAWGVVQAVNTATHHEWNVRGDRNERNMLRAVTGNVDKLDADTLATLATVLA